MATQWHYQTHGEDHGPVTFLALAELINEGVLNSQSFVKEEHDASWRHVEDIAGLMGQAKRLKAVPAPQTVPRGANPRTTTPTKRRVSLEDVPLPEEPGRPWGAYIGIVIAMGIIAGEIWWWWPRTPVAFPESRPVTLKFDIPSRLNQLAPRSRRDPKRLLQPSGPPVLVPGLEKVMWAKNPVLTPDLLTIVYVSWGGEETMDDLFLAERPATNVPFGPPQRLANCSGPKRDMFPALTSDGLQLVYAEDAGPTRLMIARRAERGKPFDPPQQLAIEKLEAGYVHVDQPQFLGPDELRIAATNGDTTKRAQFLARRSGNSFAIHSRMGFANPWPRFHLMSNYRRAYFLTNDGLCVTMQAPRTPQFTTPERWLTDEDLGPQLSVVDDSVWIAPTEDVLVYCSPGKEKPDSRDRQIWMLRLD